MALRVAFSVVSSEASIESAIKSVESMVETSNTTASFWAVGIEDSFAGVEVSAVGVDVDFVGVEVSFAGVEVSFVLRRREKNPKEARLGVFMPFSFFPRREPDLPRREDELEVTLAVSS